MGRRWKLMAIIGALVLCAAAAVGVYFVPRVVKLFSSAYEAWYDEAYDKLILAINKRWRADDRVSDATVGFVFSMVSPDSESNVLLDVRLEANIRCSLYGDEACDSLAEEYARIVTENYNRLDELGGIRVTIISRVGLGPFGRTQSVQRLYTSDEWQEKLYQKGADQG